MLIDAVDAAQRLGVQPATLYAYVSRGKVSRQRSLDGRRSLFDADEIEALARRQGRTGAAVSAVPVQITSAVTRLDTAGVFYRGHALADLVGRCSFEQVAELLWTGSLPEAKVTWVSADPVVRTAVRCATGSSPITRLASGLLGAGDLLEGAESLSAARHLLAAAPSVLGAPPLGSMAKRLANIWRFPPSKPLVAMVDRVLVTLADHELATSTFAARVAASTRADLAACLAAGLATLSGPLHGTASQGVHHLLADAEQIGVGAALDGLRRRHERVPGFGHRVYKNGDPRVPLLLDGVRATSTAPARTAVVEEFLAVASSRLSVAANVDLALGAFTYVVDLPSSAGTAMMAVARLAGMVAHVLEEYDETPLRYRVTARSAVASLNA